MTIHPTKYPTIRFVFDRRRKCSQDEAASGTIEVEVSFKGKRKWLSTGVSVLPKQWSSDKFVINHPSSAELNNRIKAVREPIDSYVNMLILAKEPFTFDSYESYMKNQQVVSGSFLTYMEEEILGRKDIRPTTRMLHNSLLHLLEDFKKISTFDSLKLKTIKEFDSWLHQKYDKQSTVFCFHAVLRTYIARAVSAGLLEKSPYDFFKPSRGRSTVRRYLSEEQIERLRSCTELPDEIETVRDLFIFQCYTGLAYADLHKFDFTKVEQRSGQYVLIDRRKKSDEDFYLVLLNPAVEILKKYNGNLPELSNHVYNARLKILAGYVRLNIKLTTHVGRHTFACLALNHGMPIEVLAKAMGHSRISTTQIYDCALWV